MKRIITKIDKLYLFIITVILVLATSTAVLMCNPYAWIAELLLSAWLLIVIIILSVQRKL